MTRAFPQSIGFFLATGVVFLLQMIPIIGIFLMIMLAMFWSVLLINAGMVGVAFEALTGRVSRGWLVLPLAFYGGYGIFSIQDRLALYQLGTAYDAANAKVFIPFDPARYALAFEGEGGEDGSSLVQNYGLSVAYSRNLNYPEGFRSNRMIARDICTEVRENPTLVAAGIYSFGFADGDDLRNRKFENRFCSLGMPERPVLPVVLVTRREDKIFHGLLPVTRLTTTVTMPDGKQFRLLGGVAAPLSWIPMPAMGCALNSGAARWDCFANFRRSGFTPIVSGTTRFGRDSSVLARALGLKQVAIDERQGGDPTLVLAKLAETEQAR